MRFFDWSSGEKLWWCRWRKVENWSMWMSLQEWSDLQCGWMGGATGRIRNGRGDSALPKERVDRAAMGDEGGRPHCLQVCRHPTFLACQQLSPLGWRGGENGGPTSGCFFDARKEQGGGKSGLVEVLARHEETDLSKGSNNQLLKTSLINY